MAACSCTAERTRRRRRIACWSRTITARAFGRLRMHPFGMHSKGGLSTSAFGDARKGEAYPIVGCAVVARGVGFAGEHAERAHFEPRVFDGARVCALYGETQQATID